MSDPTGGAPDPRATPSSEAQAADAERSARRAEEAARRAHIDREEASALAETAKGAKTVGLFIYAVLITLLAVIAIVVLARLARRIGAEPIEFKIDSKRE